MGTTEQPSITYILPNVAWASLLDIIARDAPSGAVIEVHTAEMQRIAEQMLVSLGRHDVCVRFTPQPLRRSA